MPQNGSNQGGGYGRNRDSLRFTTPSQPERPAAPRAQTPQESEYGFNGEPLSLPRARSASGSVRRTRTDNSIEFPTQQRQLHMDAAQGEPAPKKRSTTAASGQRLRATPPNRSESAKKRTAPPKTKRGAASAKRSPSASRPKPRPKQTTPRDPQRREMRKKRKVTRAVLRRRRAMRRLTAFVLLLCVIGVGIYLTMTMLFRINNIQVQTADGAAVQEIAGYTSNQILQALGVQVEDNIFSFDPGSKAEALEKQFPLLESIRVERDYPNAVVVRVTEATPAYAMQTTSGWLTLSEHFKILSCDAAQPSGLCTLYGGDPVSVQPGEQLTFAVPAASETASDASDPAASSEAEVPADDRLDTLDTLQAKLEEYGLLESVTRIEFADSNNVAFLYQNRISVLLGTLNNLDSKMEYVLYIVNNTNGKGCAPTDTGQLDLSHINMDSLPTFYLARGEPTLPSGYVVPSSVEDLAASEPTEEPADSASDAADNTEAAAEEELPLTDPARMTAVDEEDPM